MRDETLPLERRIDAAKAAAPFVHPRLATAERSETAVPIYNVELCPFLWRLAASQKSTAAPATLADCRDYIARRSATPLSVVERKRLL
jgi:hypothetical protein